jgi:hypothetical protein
MQEVHASPAQLQQLLPAQETPDDLEDHQGWKEPPVERSSQQGLSQQQQQQGSIDAQQHTKQPPMPPSPQQPWWKQVPTDPVVAHVRFASSATGTSGHEPALLPVRLSALSSVAPVELVMQALPPALANSLLAELLGESGAWVAGSWWFGGKQQTAPRFSATYRLAAQVRALGGPFEVHAGLCLGRRCCDQAQHFCFWWRCDQAQHFCLCGSALPAMLV